jgi:GT2 family glycosyltransferase
MSTARTPTVYCVVAVHNRLPVTQSFIQQIALQDYPSIRTVVVDDGSSDGTSDFLAALSDRTVQVLRGDGSLWWGGAMNMGMKYVFDVAEDTDYLLMINDDVKIGPSYVSTLVNDSVANSGAIIGSSQRDEISGALIGSGYQVDYRGMRFRAVDPDAAAVSVDALPGRGTLFPVYAARRCGYIHTLFRHYFGDLEYTARAKESGYSLLVSHRAEVFLRQEPPRVGMRKRGVAKKWLGRRSPNNIGHRLIFFSIRGPSALRVLAIPRFALLTVLKLVHRLA